MRRLRTYEHMAQKMYSCNNCNRSPIFPGDVYRGEVFAHNKRIIVMDRQRESTGGPVQEDAPLSEAA
jgi:hypothetical protein